MIAPYAIVALDLLILLVSAIIVPRALREDAARQRAKKELRRRQNEATQAMPAPTGRQKFLAFLAVALMMLAIGCSVSMAAGWSQLWPYFVLVPGCLIAFGVIFSACLRVLARFERK